MNDLARRIFLFLSLSCALLVCTGCKEREDTRSTEEKQQAPVPDLKTRLYMACPKCGAPQRPYMINELKSYYRCTGAPPKFHYHEEHKWQHTIERKECKRVEL